MLTNKALKKKIENRIAELDTVGNKLDSKKKHAAAFARYFAIEELKELLKDIS